MSEYWKSTPHYWCKFCKVYVRDTPFEKRNHESSGRHQGNIQRSLRELHKGAEIAARDKQRAKDEVARLNGLVGGNVVKSGGKKDGTGKILGVETLKSAGAGSSTPALSTAAQRKAHAEQLAAMGVKLPAALEREITGIGGWETASERPVEETQGDANGGGWVLASIKKREDEVKLESNETKTTAAMTDASRPQDGEDSRKRKAWGNTKRSYPGSASAEGDLNDLDVLLDGVKGSPSVKAESTDGLGDHSSKNDPDIDTGVVKPEPDEEIKPLPDVPPPVVFKKRKIKR